MKKPEFNHRSDAYNTLAETIVDKEGIRNTQQAVRKTKDFDKNFQTIFGSEEERLKRNAQHQSKGDQEDSCIVTLRHNLPESEGIVLSEPKIQTVSIGFRPGKKGGGR